MNDKLSERARPLRGRPYSLEEFRAKYGLDRRDADDLFKRFGPSSVELDLLMAAKRRRPSFQAVAADIIL
ncbi:hypothetical protein [Rhizobium sp. S163]|jgi:hypothetical protein|uniref:hypothetical protein n=1 Tax=Rhizobium sp. S163 TaxID=3055039 RepID=UPI000DD55696|nr:hypothetical protein [Rhizobium sp. S163]MDM9646465.1 hypothetical protein [Rhizobium sp. S163]